MIRLFTSIVGGLVLLTACQTGPDRRGPPDRESADPSARQGQLIVAPISLVFVDLDHDGDQSLARAELEEHLPNFFASADTNGSQSLDASELRAFFLTHLGSEYPVPGRLAFDPNGNQLVDQGEFAAVFTDAFTRMDANADGQLVRAEMLREFSIRVGRARGGQGRGRGGGTRGGGRG